MFTGIIEETGKVKSISSERGTILIEASRVLEKTNIGDSIAVNGVCLTVTTIQGNAFSADVMPETLRVSSLGGLVPGSRVNLERAMAADGRFGGHIVSGHIDGTGRIESLKREENAVWVTVSAPKEILDLIIYKGSIAIDGISLTVAYVDDEVFRVSIIPHTGQETTLLSKNPGDIVNLENDVIGKYVKKLLTSSNETPSKDDEITEDFLRQNGF